MKIQIDTDLSKFSIEDNNTNQNFEILCLVETPAQYQTVSKRVLKTPATTREVENPAIFETIERRELITPAKTVMIDTPAKYKTVQVTKMVSPEYERSVGAIPRLARFRDTKSQSGGAACPSTR